MKWIKTIGLCVMLLGSVLCHADQERGAYWHLIRGYELFKSKPYINQVHGMTDSVQIHYDTFQETVDEYDTNYTLGLYLISEFYHDINEYDKEIEILNVFLDKPLPETYTLDELHINLEPKDYYVQAIQRAVQVKLDMGDTYHAMKYTDLLEGDELRDYLRHRSISMDVIKASLQSDVYSKKGAEDAAIKVMIPYALEVWDQNSLEFSQKLLDRLLAKYKMRKIQAEVDLAFRELYQKDVPPGEYDDTKPFYVRLFDTEIELPEAESYGYESAYHETFYHLQTSDFYLVVTNGN